MNASGKTSKKIGLLVDPHILEKVRKTAAKENCSLNDAALLLIRKVLAPRAV